MGYSGGMLDQT